jgi:hypothetical protein
MTYRIVLRVFAVVRSQLCTGVMALIAHHAHRPQAVTSAQPFAIRFNRAPRWPEVAIGGGVMCLIVSFVAFTAICLR